MNLTINKLDYIYFLLEDNNPFYVGKTHRPKRREIEHKQTYGSHIKLVIIEVIKDRKWQTIEKKWIKTLTSWGIHLKNSNPGGGGPEKGILRSKDFGNKISKAKKGNKRNPLDVINATIAKQKPCLQYDKQGNFIKEYPSAKLASISINSHPNSMYDHLKGRYKTIKGYIFKYKQLN